MTRPTPPPEVIRIDEQDLRTVTLAQAIEASDGAHRWVGAEEVERATQDALQAARERGVARPGVADVVRERAQAIVARAAGRNATVAALRSPGAWTHWGMRVVPALALLLGLLSDQVANAHHVDLFSPPLLMLLAWNLVVYALLLVRALWPRRSGRAEQGDAAKPPPDALDAPDGAAAAHRPGAARLLRALLAALARWRPARERASARIAAAFEQRWWARTQALWGQRLACVLHLAAGAWAVGVAASLLLRGLVVHYQFGWESTFLDAPTVHALARLLFALPVALLGLPPLALADIEAAQNFAAQGVAASRWVWMYVGLLVLFVVLPRLLLALWAGLRARRLAQRCTLDLGSSDFDALRGVLPGDLVLGVPDAAGVRALGQLLARHGGQGGAWSAGDDRLCLVPADGAGDAPAVDAVLAAAGATDALPAAWQGAPRLAWPAPGAGHDLPWAALEQALAAPWQCSRLQRLRAAWQVQQAGRLDQAAQLLARHLAACAALLGDAAELERRYPQLLQALDLRLQALYAVDAPTPAVPAAGDAAPPHAPASPSASRNWPVVGDADAALRAAGTAAGAATGAAMGVKAGALLDIGSGGMTLGLGTATGALLGTMTGWLIGKLQKEGGDGDERWLAVVRLACLHWLATARQADLAQAEGAPEQVLAPWRAATDAAVARQAQALRAWLQARPEGAGEAGDVDGLQALVLAMLSRLEAPAP